MNVLSFLAGAGVFGLGIFTGAALVETIHNKKSAL